MKPARTRAIYAGSFDPITFGHLDIIQKALLTFDVVHVAVGINPLKAGLFDVDERLDLIAQSVIDLGLAGQGTLPPQVEIGAFEGESVIKYAHRIGATHIVRGLRQSSDFDDEFRYHGILGRLEPNMPMIHIICRETFLHVSSSTARELASLGEDVSWLVTPSVERALRAKFGEPAG
ncbi:MAG: pantetheine-phosphate adenylyltransferase [Phenylobacterium sp.]|uniref:pantetheine-phosphate adenylyltransferase n=1 Tax=Phenylobacterium sp. TaxID=1871053 RepID=UPI0025D11199|nr:pantetheine-phosphate adenylyltransferase [Phenylobacterium sp.]MBA4011036.1 pantetheine-phosphate adenylyltransferase [Phenylobacterium sp.]